MKEEFLAEVANLRFLQDYVKRPAVEAKKLVEHLMLTRGEHWRENIADLAYKGVDRLVLRELSFIDLELPIIVQPYMEDGIWVVKNGVHTSYAYWEQGRQQIRAELGPNKGTIEGKVYTFEELRVEGI